MDDGGRMGFDAAPRTTRYIPTLDGWRAVAVVVVMLQHASDQIQAVLGDGIGPVMDVFREDGRFGVYIFFAISGYLITSLLLDEMERTGGASLAAFYIRRAFRILPPLLVVLAVFGLLGVLGVIPIPGDKWLGSLFFVNNYTPGEAWYLGHLWSLAIEEQFYVLWPTILVLCRPRLALRICVVLIAVVGVWRLVDMSFGITDSWPLFVDDRTDTRVDGLLWGCLLAMTCRRADVRARVAAMTAGWRWWALLIALAVSQAADQGGAVVSSMQLAVRPALVALLVVGTVLTPTTRVARTLERPTWRWIGRLSYSLYLWQQLFLVWDRFDVPALAWAQWFPFSVACAFVMAWLSHRYIERPAVALGRRVAARVRQRPDDLVAAAT